MRWGLWFSLQQRKPQQHHSVLRTELWGWEMCFPALQPVWEPQSFSCLGTLWEKSQWMQDSGLGFRCVSPHQAQSFPKAFHIHCLDQAKAHLCLQQQFEIVKNESVGRRRPGYTNHDHGSRSARSAVRITPRGLPVLWHNVCQHPATAAWQASEQDLPMITCASSDPASLIHFQQSWGPHNLPTLLYSWGHLRSCHQRYVPWAAPSQPFRQIFSLERSSLNSALKSCTAHAKLPKESKGT